MFQITKNDGSCLGTVFNLSKVQSLIFWHLLMGRSHEFMKTWANQRKIHLGDLCFDSLLACFYPLFFCNNILITFSWLFVIDTWEELPVVMQIQFWENSIKCLKKLVSLRISPVQVFVVEVLTLFCVYRHYMLAYIHICRNNRDILLIHTKLNENLLMSSLFSLCCCR